MTGPTSPTSTPARRNVDRGMWQRADLGRNRNNQPGRELGSCGRVGLEARRLVDAVTVGAIDVLACHATFDATGAGTRQDADSVTSERYAMLVEVIRASAGT
jgi:hypothetical protein